MIREVIKAAAVALAILAAAIVGVLVGGLIFGAVSAQEADDRCSVITLDEGEAYLSCVHEEPICLNADDVGRDWFLLASMVDGEVLKSNGVVAFFGAIEGGFTPRGNFAVVAMWVYHEANNVVCELAVAGYIGEPA